MVISFNFTIIIIKVHFGIKFFMIIKVINNEYSYFDFHSSLIKFWDNLNSLHSWLLISHTYSFINDLIASTRNKGFRYYYNIDISYYKER